MPAGYRSEADVIALSGLFDADWYSAQYEDVLESGSDPLEHFCLLGWREGLLPNFYFDPAWYLATYGPGDAEGTNPLVHYIEQGEREGAWPSPQFDPEWYRDQHGLEADESPLRHFLLRRASGLVSPLPDFDVESYCLAHPEVLSEGRDPYEDYVTRGGDTPVETPPGVAEVPALGSVPTYAMIEAVLGLDPGSEPPRSIAWDSMVEVIRLFLRRVPVDETWYCTVYPDVAEAIREGELASAQEHFVAHGYFEERSPSADADAE